MMLISQIVLGRCGAINIQATKNQKNSSSNFHKLLQERIEKASLSRKLSAEESKRLNTLEAMADKLKRGENVQNRQLKTWLSEEEYEQLEYEWQEQLELRN